MTKSALVALALVSTICSAQSLPGTPSPAQQLTQLSDRFIAQSLRAHPTLSELAGVPYVIHNRFTDLSPRAIRAFDKIETHNLDALHEISPEDLPQASRAAYASLEEQLESDLQMRVCRTELWDVNHFTGWQTNMPDVAERQPITTPVNRKQALERWASLPKYIDQDIANLREGERLGYSAPQSVVRRVIVQINGFLALPPEKSPFYSPAARAATALPPDPAFSKAFRRIITDIL